MTEKTNELLKEISGKLDKMIELLAKATTNPLESMLEAFSEMIGGISEEGGFPFPSPSGPPEEENIATIVIAGEEE